MMWIVYPSHDAFFDVSNIVGRKDRRLDCTEKSSETFYYENDGKTNFSWEQEPSGSSIQRTDNSLATSWGNTRIIKLSRTESLPAMVVWDTMSRVYLPWQLWQGRY